jgi:exodeoxyribonuclease VII large subunit
VEQIVLAFGPERSVVSVSELNAAIRGVLDREFFDVWVSGEISGVKLAASGHYYFTLKDAESQLRCVCFRSTARFLKFKPQDGAAVLARGRIDVYEARGEYQLQIEALELHGYGALQFAFEQLKKKLAAEGLFEQSRKRPLPRYPARIGIVTSRRGAVISDMLHVLSRRFPGLHIRLFPAQVQGPGSIEEVCRGIQYFSRGGWAEVVIVARGGGSLEDLWTFNEEAVARAIAASEPPVISAIGHETDFTIADFVADLRAPTPSAAAELVVRTQGELLDQIEGLRHKLIQVTRYGLAMDWSRVRQSGVERARSLFHRTIGRRLQRVDELQYRMRERLRVAVDGRRRAAGSLKTRLQHYDPRPRLSRDRSRRQAAQSLLVYSVRLQLSRRRARLEALEAKLGQLSPLTILGRGYAIVTGQDGHVLMDAAAAPEGSSIDVRLARGGLQAEVKKRLLAADERR